MAIFGKKEKKTTKKATAKKVKASSTNLKTTSADLTWVLLKPRITERAAFLSEKKVYVFEVAEKANKRQIKEAITLKFGVAPIKVNTVNQTPKSVVRRGRATTKPGFKKAYVYLNQNDTIEFV
jgi:large subunit ribosomal protein L23